MVALNRKFFVKRVIEGKKEMTGRQGRRIKRLIEAVKEAKGTWKLKEEALDRAVWRTH